MTGPLFKDNSGQIPIEKVSTLQDDDKTGDTMWIVNLIAKTMPRY